MTPPAWATELVATVCAEARVDQPRLLWRRREALHSTGVARRHDGVIAVRAGADELDQRLTLLHELAHWIGPEPRRRRGRSVHHGRGFYRVAFDLYRRHAIPEADALRLEAGRYRSALGHAVALGVRGAAAALEEHRSAQRARARRRWSVLVPEHRVSLVRDGRWTVCATCRQRVVGSNLARIRRARRPVRHVLMTTAP
jgi:hypothetical protein